MVLDAELIEGRAFLQEAVMPRVIVFDVIETNLTPARSSHTSNGCLATNVCCANGFLNFCFIPKSPQSRVPTLISARLLVRHWR